MFRLLRKWPPISRNPGDIPSYFGNPMLGLDFEWDMRTGAPTIIGVGNMLRAVSVHWDDGRDHLRALLTRYPKTVLVGHNIVGADLEVIEREFGIRVPLERVEDTIIWHYLVNPHLCKSSKKSSVDEGEGGKRGRGFMNLGTMASLYTDFPYWKECRDSACDGPCPKHDVFGYNGVDSMAPVIALPKLKKAAMLRGVDKLYPMHRELAHVLAKMRARGVQVDVPYVEELRREHEAEKDALAKELPFNPDSPKQAPEYFKEKHGLSLADMKEETVKELVDELGDDAPAELLDLQEYKELGNGPDRWFAPLVYEDNEWRGFVDERGLIHPNLAFYTSSGRMNCSSPNLQNVAKRRKSRRVCECSHHRSEHIDGACIRAGCSCTKFSGESMGKKIRRAIIAPPGYFIVRADYSNAENRVMLYHAGYMIDPHRDLHNWVVELAGFTDDMEFCFKMGGARESAKSVQHAGNYLEGLQLFRPEELKSARIQREIAAGARIVYPSWTFEGKVVTFNGVNLAKRAFGSASWEHRKAALEIANKYFGGFPDVRALQQRITRQCEVEKLVRPPHGYVTLSYGRAEERMKTAAAIWGSQPVAHISKLALIRLEKAYEAGRPMYPVLQVHDEVLCYAKQGEIDPLEGVALLRGDMEIETPEMPGFVMPADGSYGDNWRDQAKVKR